jgi:Xaa-Pro aminopeptidase
MWTNDQIKNHKEAARKLTKIVKAVFEYIKKNKKDITERQVQLFIYEQFRKHNLKTDKTPMIVAFGSSAADPHYDPTSSGKKLKSGDVIMIDIWARLNKYGAPFADITWMGYAGKSISKESQKIFDIVIGARDAGIKYTKSEIKKKKMPTGHEIDREVREYIHKHGHGEKFIHGTGHSLGLQGPHGSWQRIRQDKKRSIHKNLAYTIEPGIYLENNLGTRSEIDFYVDEDFRFILTTQAQRRIIKI